ncbi:MAG TPA: hypothetical protein VIJ68_03420 [Candidatus Saccharimonadales bacterium]
MLERVVDYAREHPTRVAGVAAAAGGVALYKALQPEKHTGGENYFDIIGNLDECIRASAGEDVQYVMLGGGAAAALMNEETVIDTENKLITPPADIRKPQYRFDTGTMADVDILVVSADEEVIDKVRAALEPNLAVLQDEESTEAQKARELAKPGARLKVGVTGLESAEEYNQEPAGLKDKAKRVIRKDWVSRRLQDADGAKSFVISDVEVYLPDEYFDQWRLQLPNGETVPTLHPLIQVLCYTSRASHGIRKRDVSKVSKIMDNVGPDFGASLEWGSRQRTASIALEEPTTDPGVKAARRFSDTKNELRWRYTKERLGKPEAALLAARMALHRQLDTRKFFVQFGQGGLIYDKLLSRISGERQQALSPQA